MTWMMILFSIGFGAASAHFGEKKGYSYRLFFFLGFLFGIFALAVVLFLPNKKKKSSPIEAPKEEPFFIDEKNSSKLWYYLTEEKEQIGPVSFSFLKKKIKEGKIFPSTYIWNEDFSDWKKLEEFTNSP